MKVVFRKLECKKVHTRGENEETAQMALQEDVPDGFSRIPTSKSGA